MYKYAIRYNFNQECREEGYTEDQSDGNGLCDAIIGISIILPPDGSYSQQLICINGKTKKPMTQDEIFKAWLTLGMSLRNEDKVTGWKKYLLNVLHEFIIKIFANADKT